MSRNADVTDYCSVTLETADRDATDKTPLEQYGQGGYAYSSDGEEYTKYEASRVIATWLNGTYGMIPYIGYRAETRGAYGEWKTKQVRRISALDPSELTSDQVDTLLDAYEEVRDRE
jgi:hypothetical protein